MTHRQRARAATLAALLGLLLVGLLTPTASAARAPLEAFTSVDSTPDGCTSTVVTAIGGSPGVRYYHHGKRLHLPTKRLRFDEDGVVELVAKARHGRLLTRYSYRLLAPRSCFVDLAPDPTVPRYDPVVSWCTSDHAPYLAEVFTSDETIPVVWTLRRHSDRRLVDVGQVTVGGGTGEARFDVRSDLPRGRYVLEASEVISGPGLYPWSTPVEQYRCLKTPKVKQGRVTFRVPEHGPAVLLVLSVPSSVDPVRQVRVRAGHAYTFRTQEPQVSWTALAQGNHVGELGHGTVEVPQR